MDTIFNFVHKMCACIAFAVSLLLLDIPLKIILCVLFLILALVLSIFYPITKNLSGPEWLADVYEYASTRQLIATYVWKCWNY